MLDGKTSDRAETKFGIREVKSEVLSANRRLFSDQWQEHSDPRRRLVSRHDAARELAAPARRVPLRAGHGPEHDPPRRQAGDQRILRSGRRARHSAHRRLVLLRSLGALAELEAAGLHHRGTIVARPDLPPARPSQPGGVDERQRQSAAARRRADLPESRKRAAVAESGGLLRHRKTRRLLRRERRKDDRALRIRRAFLLADRQNRLDHPHSATRAAAAEPTASTPKPAWDRPCRRSKAFAPWSAKIISGRSTTPGTITPAAERSKTSTFSPTR